MKLNQEQFLSMMEMLYVLANICLKGIHRKFQSIPLHIHVPAFLSYLWLAIIITTFQQNGQLFYMTRPTNGTGGWIAVERGST